MHKVLNCCLTNIMTDYVNSVMLILGMTFDLCDEILSCTTCWLMRLIKHPNDWSAVVLAAVMTSAMQNWGHSKGMKNDLLSKTNMELLLQIWISDSVVSGTSVRWAHNSNQIFDHATNGAVCHFVFCLSTYKIQSFHSPPLSKLNVWRCILDITVSNRKSRI